MDTTIEDLNKQSFASSVSTSYAHSSGFSVDKFELTGKQGKIVTETSISGAAPGLTLEFKGDTKSAGDLSATYEAPSFTATGGMDIVDFKSADASVCSGSGPLTFGAALKLALPSGSSAFSLSDYSVGASYKVYAKKTKYVILAFSIRSLVFLPSAPFRIITTLPPAYFPSNSLHCIYTSNIRYF